MLRKWLAGSCLLAACLGLEAGAGATAPWSFQPLRRPPLPPQPAGGWVRSPVDAFILAGHAAHGWRPAPEAAPAAWLRRVTLDLTGLPPTLAEQDAFLADASPAARGRVVDRLLASPRFGERMAQDWLDAARFADTNGYQVDRDREMWAWRDWVVQAFNRNLPFDQFTIEQLAGDLLPDATLDQRVATGFHRNHMINEEGGVIPEEFLAEYCADRVETTATVWLGLTMNCARCHDHKHDPLTQRDFYSLLAFFHNVPENGVGDYGASIRRNTPPFLQLPTPEAAARLSEAREELARASREADRLRKDRGPGQPASDPKDPALVALEQRVADLRKRVDELELGIPVTLVMAEMPTPRPTHVLVRGSYQQRGEVVTAAPPSRLPPFRPEWPRNRLGLARWLVAPENPLTARVAVNRLWQSLFGIGLVRTSEDFGLQGEPPTHPELLDWLASEYVRTGWDTKALLRQLVLSATYGQDSRGREELAAGDPENRWLARGPRHRLPVEAIRDQALAAGGLLSGILGGPSVRPYHPPGLYEQVVAGSSASTYVQGSGDDLYRRTLYTYWKRSVPNPSLLLFDMPFREACTVRRARTSTPLQALNLLNDPTYVEAARALAGRMMQEGGAGTAARVRHGCRLVLGREPRGAELGILEAGLRRSLASFRRDPEAARALVSVGASPATSGLDPVELAAFTTVAGTLLNLDETVTKP